MLPRWAQCRKCPDYLCQLQVRRASCCPMPEQVLCYCMCPTRAGPVIRTKPSHLLILTIHSHFLRNCHGPSCNSLESVFVQSIIITLMIKELPTNLTSVKKIWVIFKVFFTTVTWGKYLSFLHYNASICHSVWCTVWTAQWVTVEWQNRFFFSWVRLTFTIQYP